MVLVKKLLIGCGAVTMLGIVGVVLIAIIGIVAGARQPTQTVTNPAAAPASTAPATTADATKPVSVPAQPVAKPEEKAGTPAHVGERIESAGIALTVNSVKKADAVGQLLKAKPGRSFLTADVSLESSGREKAPYNPLYFKVKDVEGYEYTASPIGDDNSLKSGELAPGEKVRGTVSFDVPNEAKALVMSYQPLVIFGGYQTIRVSLE